MFLNQESYGLVKWKEKKREIDIEIQVGEQLIIQKPSERRM